MLKLYFIRHSLTEGNLKKKYVGRTDEPLCEEGIQLLNYKVYPKADFVYCSPMRRCLQTAAMIYPDSQLHIIENFKECNFGRFENKNYVELSDDLDYQKWIDSNGTLPFPEGESREAFVCRTKEAFEKIINCVQCFESKSISFVVHGGTIMSIMEYYAMPNQDYYSWQVGNGEGIRADIFIEENKIVIRNAVFEQYNDENMR